MTTAWDALPHWMLPPRPSGWEADDLDNAPGLPRHTKLIDGALIFMISPQRSWHARVVTRLTTALDHQAAEGCVMDRDMTVKLNEKNRPEPAVLAVTVPRPANRPLAPCRR
ncbi:Uma2 family endonuclease [Streptomyces sp. NPDC048419]|uniref:Uma2 family endonuclease n=1 Tax=Streptomyces sp. NPDC048419 TaxID=3365547 RepID=UPI00370FDE49